MARFCFKPSKPASAVGMDVGLAFVGFGLFVAIPAIGTPGVV